MEQIKDAVQKNSSEAITILKLNEKCFVDIAKIIDRHTPKFLLELYNTLVRICKIYVIEE